MITKAEIIKQTANEVGQLKLYMNDGNNFYVPWDDANRFYQEYLEWVAAGNTATIVVNSSLPNNNNTPAMLSQAELSTMMQNIEAFLAGLNGFLVILPQLKTDVEELSAKLDDINNKLTIN